MNHFLYFILFSFLSQIACATTLVQKLKKTDIVHKVQTLAKAGKIPGLAVAVVSESGDVLDICYGLEKVGENDRLISNSSVFRLASMSKLVTGVLSVVLEDKKLLSLNDKVIGFVKDFELSTPQHTHNTTLLHLLSHTVGFSRHTYTDLIESGFTLTQIQPKLKNVKLIGAPGQVHAYQNVSFSLIHPYLENKLHKNLEDIYETFLFKPFGMNQASLGVGGYELSTNVAIPHVRGGSSYVASKNNPNYDEVIPAAGVNASLNDMILFLKALLGGNPTALSTLARQRLFEPVSNSPDETIRYKKWNPHVKKSSYGVGMRHYDYDGHRVCGHAGWLRGFSNRLYILPDEKIGIVVLCNSESRVPDYVWTTIAHEIWSLDSPYEKYLMALQQVKKSTDKKNTKKSRPLKNAPTKTVKVAVKKQKSLDVILASSTKKAPK